jgi:hypothetical protein
MRGKIYGHDFMLPDFREATGILVLARRESDEV